MKESLPLNARINRFLFKYHNTPHSITQENSISPADEQGDTNPPLYVPEIFELSRSADMLDRLPKQEKIFHVDAK